jgi:hypothetical protein
MFKYYLSYFNNFIIICTLKIIFDIINLKIKNDELACIQVSNHSSLIELMMICYLTEDGNTPSFVSKIEIKSMPFLGIIG